MDVNINSVIKLRRGTTSEWTGGGRILQLGEPGFDTDLKVLKIGNGVDTWDKLKPVNQEEFTKIFSNASNITSGTLSIDRLSTNTANGTVKLDAQGKVPAAQLPAYVDDVLEFDKKASFPQTGEDGKIYVAEDTNLTYRWSGSQYVEISQSLALGETAETAYAGNKGKANADAIAALQTRATNIETVNTTQTNDITSLKNRADNIEKKNTEQDASIKEAKDAATQASNDAASVRDLASNAQKTAQTAEQAASDAQQAAQQAEEIASDALPKTGGTLSGPLYGNLIYDLGARVYSNTNPPPVHSYGTSIELDWDTRDSFSLPNSGFIGYLYIQFKYRTIQSNYVRICLDSKELEIIGADQQYACIFINVSPVFTDYFETEDPLYRYVYIDNNKTLSYSQDKARNLTFECETHCPYPGDDYSDNQCFIYLHGITY